ncbi:RNI-like protein [Punctularia strigosozonata HHB-11173 SS5]|uniref:RNI-like protein n=1 Tax=Punctularia strigosozonata (strain HHB-11173) TaxID=741275 RepID=UPI00044184FE|nr:RNI-like protein [Punctularia strigosozonata HHB-11173 SS5]EIN07095.1 RNI-like protein [Punctularia strigosozonata HHB-11173 SS5]
MPHSENLENSRCRVGSRFNLNGQLGTIRYIGPVDGTRREWLGVEWDDPLRGKHDGTKGGKRYFSCLHPGAGSFIRDTSAINWGFSFLTALRSKYVEDLHGSSEEWVTLGSSKGAIEVEVVGLDRIRSNLAQLERLRNASLDGENVAVADAPGLISRASPSLRRLDLSKNLLPDWDTVASITVELANLEHLSLNNNRFGALKLSGAIVSAFVNLRELQLNATAINWDDLKLVTSGSVMPKLRTLEAGYNHIGSLQSKEQAHDVKPAVFEVLNLDTNALDDWLDIVAGVTRCPAVTRLILTSNKLGNIPSQDTTDVHLRLSGIKHISLVSNRLTSWASIDALASWCPELESLSVAANPFLDDTFLGRHSRQLIVAKIPSLRTLDASQVTDRERNDCELFYLSLIAQQGPTADEARQREHPQWERLCKKHGRPDNATPRKNTGEKLSSRLIEVHLVLATSSDPSFAEAPPTATIRVLPSMSIRAFSAKVQKSFKGSAQPAPRRPSEFKKVRFWLRVDGGSRSATDDLGSEAIHAESSDASNRRDVGVRWVELDVGNDSKDLAWWGIEDQSTIAAHIDS